MHAIGVPEGVTLLEFDGMSQRDLEVQQPKLEVQKMQLATEES
jgi:hypothetical protein